MTFEYIKKENKKLIGGGLILLGAFLEIQHIFTYGGIDLFDFFGHEVVGIIFIIAGLLVANRWGRLKFKEAIIYAKDKFKWMFKCKKRE